MVQESTLLDINEAECDFYEIKDIFLSNLAVVEFLRGKGWIKESFSCQSCLHSFCTLKKNKKLKNIFYYRCANTECKREKSIFSGFNSTELPKIDLKKIIFAAYLFSLKLQNFQAYFMCGISEKTYIKLKRIFISCLERGDYVETNKLGGEGCVLQVDETACNRRRLITSPTSEAPYVRGTKWVVGIICEATRKIKLEVLENRTTESIAAFFRRNVHEGSIIKSDGYPSYTGAVAQNNCTHLVVNHSLGFTTIDGINTNMIENLWSHLKTDIRTKRGVMFANLEEFIKSWEILYNNTNRSDRENINKLFFLIIKNL